MSEVNPTPENTGTGQEAKTQVEPQTGTPKEEKATLLSETPKQEGTQPKEGEKKEPEPKVEPKKVPEKYDLKLPKDSKLGASHLEKIASFAKERGFSQEEAQALLERDNSLQSELLASYEKSYQKGGEGWTKLVDDYEKEALNDPEIGGSIENLTKHAELARRVVSRFDGKDGALSKLLAESPFGSHPSVVRFLSGIGKAMSDDKFVWGDNPSQPKSIAERLYKGEAGQ